MFLDPHSANGGESDGVPALGGKALDLGQGSALDGNPSQGKLNPPQGKLNGE
ncbi:MAG TPA: hypothetical protein VH988_05000 [Thermoanaerobaculia bacterium]|nr:hypothetical protein [Thermoanaerobaculia bacterium]